MSCRHNRSPSGRYIGFNKGCKEDKGEKHFALLLPSFPRAAWERGSEGSFGAHVNDIWLDLAE